jgi:hypothetical protein
MLQGILSWRFYCSCPQPFIKSPDDNKNIVPDINYFRLEGESKTMEVEDEDEIMEGNSSVIGGIRIGCRLSIEEFKATNDDDMMEVNALDVGCRQPDSEQRPPADDVSDAQPQPQQQQIVVSDIVSLFSGDDDIMKNPRVIKIGAACVVQLIVNFIFRNLPLKSLLTVDVVVLLFMVILFVLLDFLLRAMSEPAKPLITYKTAIYMIVHNAFISVLGMFAGFSIVVICFHHVIEANDLQQQLSKVVQDAVISAKLLNNGEEENACSVSAAGKSTSITQSSTWFAQVLERLDPRTYVPLFRVIAFIVSVLYFWFGGVFAIRAIVHIFGIIASVIGNTVLRFLPWPCYECGKFSPVAAYGGNVFQGDVDCPRCRLYLYGQENDDENRLIRCHRCRQRFVLAQYHREEVAERWWNIVNVYCPECNGLQ